MVWRAWSDDVFAQAKREHKFVFLDLEAGWCHWCHVMDGVTYRDADVIRALNAHYLCVRVDQDSRPDLAARYEDFGWPATVIYNADGGEIAKRRGYIPPQPMVRLLQAVVADPVPVDRFATTPEAFATSGDRLGDARREALRQQWRAGYDDKAGGWGFSHKFLDWDCVELALREAAAGEVASARRARETLRLQRHLIDPIWGGVYQYSVGGVWTEPHFEKIMPMQAENLRIYAQAYAQWGDPADLETARSIARYLRQHLTSPDGAFYTSQDADGPRGEDGAAFYALGDAGRRTRQAPRVDRHIYARENGWAISALAQFSAWTDDRGAGAEAARAAQWVCAHRFLPDGGFRHDECDAAGPYLGDTLAMGRAFWSLYQATADPQWLARAMAAANFIRAHFGRGPRDGYAEADTSRPVFPPPRPEFDENVAVARFAAVLAAATSRADDRDMAASALRWVFKEGDAEARGPYVAGLLLAEQEAHAEPLHVAVVGRRDHPLYRELLTEARHCPEAYKWIEARDRGEGAALSGGDIYPVFEAPAAYVCSSGACSAPIFTVAALNTRLGKFSLADGP